MIWDIGAIAESSDPKVARPGADTSPGRQHRFLALSPPANISVTVNGKTYNEMHVDGGDEDRSFLYPLVIQPLLRSTRLSAGSPSGALYVIRNNKISPEYTVVKANLVSVTERSIKTLIKADGISDLFEQILHCLTQGRSWI